MCCLRLSALITRESVQDEEEKNTHNVLHMAMSLEFLPCEEARLNSCL